jgi:hypothetical protein
MGELVFWGLVYSTLSLSLTHLLNDTQLANFENFRKKLEEDLRDYPMIFMLGFFVSGILCFLEFKKLSIYFSCIYSMGKKMFCVKQNNDN